MSVDKINGRENEEEDGDGHGGKAEEVTNAQGNKTASEGGW